MSDIAGTTRDAIDTKFLYNDKEYTIIDKLVPFYQIAIHGFVDYTGEALNLTANSEDELLPLITPVTTNLPLHDTLPFTVP